MINEVTPINLLCYFFGQKIKIKNCVLIIMTAHTLFYWKNTTQRNHKWDFPKKKYNHIYRFVTYCIIKLATHHNQQTVDVSLV